MIFMPFLLKYPWPGNIRELKNAVMSMCASTEGNKINISSLPASIVTYFKESTIKMDRVSIPPRGIDLKKLISDIERTYFKEALKISKGNRSEAARLLGIKPHTFRKALKERFPDI